jgi:hypothetical protein
LGRDPENRGPDQALQFRVSRCNSTSPCSSPFQPREVRTQNPWEEGAATYEGVLLRDLLKFVEANGTVLTDCRPQRLQRRHDVADAETIDVILAFKRNGKYMPVREKGPLFVVFPFSDQPALKVQQRFEQSVWQVSRITVK